MSESVLRGLCAPLLHDDINTDVIIPSSRIRSVGKTGHADALFAPLRYNHNGTLNTSFILNQSRYKRATFIAAGRNFGCGSSREFAVWALRDFGIKALFAESFGAIFQQNCLQNGLYPVCLSKKDLVVLSELSNNEPVAINLKTLELSIARHVFQGEVEGEILSIEAHFDAMMISKQYIEWHREDVANRPWLYQNSANNMM